MRKGYKHSRLCHIIPIRYICKMEIKIFKFGGASVNSADGIRNVSLILKKYRNENIIVVISAMGKTTNSLEELLHYYIQRDSLLMVETYNRIRKFHFDILRELFPGKEEEYFADIHTFFEQLRGYLRKGHTLPGAMKTYNFEYDQVVSFGELFSSSVLHHYLKESGLMVNEIDAREVIKTDFSYRDARVDWAQTEKLINDKVYRIVNDSKPGNIIITQGFIGSDPFLNSTTLGREGSDYTAAIFAYSLKTSEVVIWKDVPGVMNADPKWNPEAKKLDSLSYLEAIELAYFGASVIHPKTIKPLENANISLYVKSFINPDDEGTLVRNFEKWSVSFPIFIRKQNQVLISISPKDFSFILEENLSRIFDLLAHHHVKVNVMQNSAISFSICVDYDPLLEKECIPSLQEEYNVKYNKNLELYTIRHYDQKAIDSIQKGKKVLLEQKTRSTVHLILEQGPTAV